MRALIVCTVVALVALGIAGCQEVEEGTAPADTEKVEAAVEQPADAAPEAEAPATDKPKDHPAH